MNVLRCRFVCLRPLSRPYLARQCKRAMCSGEGQPPTLTSTVVQTLAKYRRGLGTLAANIRVACNLVSDTVSDGRKLNDRERRHLYRTGFDLLKLLPFAVLAAAPGGSVLVPVLARLAPWALPTTLTVPSKTALRDISDEDERALQERMNEHLRLAVEEQVSRLRAQQRGEIEHANAISRFLEAGEVFVNPGEEASSESGLGLTNEVVLGSMDTTQLAAVARRLGVAAQLTRHRLRRKLEMRMAEIAADDALLAEEGTAHMQPSEVLVACSNRGVTIPTLDLGRVAAGPVRKASFAQRLRERLGNAADPAETPLPPARLDTETVKMLRNELETWLRLSVRLNVPCALLVLAKATDRR